jgi:hypothetical protein
MWLGSKHLFTFYVKDNGWLVMKYKNKTTDESWLHVAKAGRMWSEDDTRNPHLPSGYPPLVPYKHMWGNEEVNVDVTNMEKEVCRATKNKQ